MTDLEKVTQWLDELKNCPDTHISNYFAPTTDLFKYLPKAERSECARAFYQWAEENAEKEPLKFYYAQFLTALNYFMCEEYEPALNLLIKARKSFEELGDNDGLSLCAILNGAIYRTMGNFDLALKKLWEGFVIMKQSGKYPTFFAACTNSLANINLEMHDYDGALEMFNISYEESLKANDFYFNIYALHGLGNVKMKQNKYAEAKEYLEKALQEAEKNKFPMHIANSATELAKFYFQMGEYSRAEQLNKQALALREENNFMGAAVTSCINLGEIYIKQAKCDEALQALNKGLAMAEQIKVKPKMYQVHYLLSEIYKNKNDLEKSMYHFRLFHDLQRQVEQEDSARKLADAKLIFEAEQTKKENIIIKKQKKEIEEKNIELQDTIDELTLTKISRKAKALTLLIAIVLFVFEDSILAFALGILSTDNYYISLAVKMGIVFSLNPIDKTIQHFLLRKVIKKKSRLSNSLA